MKKCSQLDISITIALQTKNSPVLDTGRCPKLKSDEFFVCKAIDIEISRCEHFDFSHSHYKFFGAGPHDYVLFIMPNCLSVSYSVQYDR